MLAPCGVGCVFGAEDRPDLDVPPERLVRVGEELKGRVKGAAGDLVDDEQLQAEGRAEELKGQARQKANQ